MKPSLESPPIHCLSASAIAAAVGARRLSAVQVVTAHLERIAAVNPQINALVQISRDEALNAALAADAQVACGGPLGPLHGVPFTVKDVVDMAGVVGAAGMPERVQPTARAAPSPAGGRLGWGSSRQEAPLSPPHPHPHPPPAGEGVKHSPPDLQTSSDHRDLRRSRDRVIGFCDRDGRESTQRSRLYPDSRWLRAASTNTVSMSGTNRYNAT